MVMGIFKQRSSYRLSLLEVLKQMGQLLSLKHPHLQKYPRPTLAGEYFSYRLTIEGKHKKLENKKGVGFCFLITIELPHLFRKRIFIQSEQKKTSLKPIAELKLVHTAVESFDRHFLLMASDERLASALFQPYLCQKILALEEKNWQMDVHEKGAHLEVGVDVLNAQALTDFLKTIVDCLNGAMTLSFKF